MNEYTATQAKRLFGEIINECVYGKKTIAIKRHNKTVAYVIPPSLLKEKEKPLEKPLALVEDLKKLWAKYPKKNKKPVDNVKLIREMREERMQHLERIALGRGKHD